MGVRLFTERLALGEKVLKAHPLNRGLGDVLMTGLILKS